MRTTPPREGVNDSEADSGQVYPLSFLQIAPVRKGVDHKFATSGERGGSKQPLQAPAASQPTPPSQLALGAVAGTGSNWWERPPPAPPAQAQLTCCSYLGIDGAAN